MMPHQAPRTTHRWLVDKIEADVTSIVGDGARALFREALFGDRRIGTDRTADG
jgi:hypothetical protein